MAGDHSRAPRVLTAVEREKIAQILASNGNVSRVAEAIGLNTNDVEARNKFANDPRVQKRAMELVRTKFARNAITGDRVMTELARLAFATAKDMFDPETGRMLDIREMDDDTAATVIAFEVEERFEGRGDGATPYTVKKIKRGDKLGALTILAKHFKLVNDEDGVNALAGALADRLNAAKRRVLVQQVDDVYAEPQAVPFAPTSDAETIDSVTQRYWAEQAAQDSTPAPTQDPTTAPEGDDDEQALW